MTTIATSSDKKASRLALLKARWNKKADLELSPVNAAFCEELREEDADLTIKDLSAGVGGEDEKWEVEGKPSLATEDEENEEASDEFASDELKGVYGLRAQRWGGEDTDSDDDDEKEETE